MKIRISLMLFILCLVFIFNFTATAQVEGEDVSIAKSFTMNSKVLNREVNVLIRVPEGYDTSSSSYPVFYDLNTCYTYDCGTVELLSRILNIPDMIVVGVPGFDNGYVPTPFEDRSEEPQTADLSIKFLKKELIPFVDEHYRTNDFRVLYGHSVGGLFTMYTLFNYPELFTAYIAGSPWFQTNDQYWLKNIEKMAEKRDLTDKFLFMTVGKDESQLTLDTYKELEKWMGNQSFPGLEWQSMWVDGDHGSMVGRNIYEGLLFIFKEWKIPETLLRDADVDEIDLHIKKSLEKWGKYGLEAQTILPEQRLNALGYALIRMTQNDKAVKIFKYNLKLYPKFFNAHDSLAEAYMVVGDKDKAIEYYKRAIELNPGNTEYAQRVLQNSKDKLRELGVVK